MSNNKTHKRVLNLLGVATFILFGMPKLSLKFGPLPIYAIDVLLFVIYLNSRPIKSLLRPRFNVATLIYIIAGIAVFSEVYGAIVMGEFLRPIYLATRTFLAISVFFSVSKIVQKTEDLLIIGRFALFGGLVSAALLILTSLGATRGFITATVFSISFLEPSYYSVEILENAQDATRGRSLIGVSILSGAFLNTIWPIMLYMRGFKVFIKRYKLLILLSVFLIPIGITFTYSRGAILGLLLVVLGIVFYNGGKARGLIIFGVSSIVIFFSTIGWNSDLFYFERITKSTARIFEEGAETTSETERRFAYSEPFEHLVQNPLFLFFGEGFGRFKVYNNRSNRLNAGMGKATHAVFAKAYYSYGMIASLGYIFLLLRAFHVTLSYARVSGSNNQATIFSRALMASLLGLFPWFLLGHAVVSTTRGGILFFFILGLVSAQSNIHYSERYKAWFFKVKWPKIKAMRQRQIAKQKELAEAS